MNEKRFLNPDGSPANIWACGVCKQVFADEGFARQCCTCVACGKPFEEERGFKEKGPGRYHSGCWTRQCAERAKAMMAKAEVLDKWDGWVINDLAGGGPMSDGYAENLDDMGEHLEDQLLCGELVLEDWPSYVYVCDAVPMRKVTIDDIIDLISDDLPEDGEDLPHGCAELGKALDAFNEANKGVALYRFNHSKVVKLGPPSQECLNELGGRLHEEE